MLSVIIATLDCKFALARTLAAFVPGAIDGLVSEAMVADGGSCDGTAIVADAAGCTFSSVEGPLGLRLKMAAAKARAPFLLFVRPGVVLDAGWIGEARQFAERSSPDRAAVFRRVQPNNQHSANSRRYWQARSAPCPAPTRACSYRANSTTRSAVTPKRPPIRNAASSAASADGVL